MGVHFANIDKPNCSWTGPSFHNKERLILETSEELLLEKERAFCSISFRSNKNTNSGVIENKIIIQSFFDKILMYNTKWGRHKNKAKYLWKQFTPPPQPRG